MTTRQINSLLRCSFCGKHQKEVKKLIAGPTVYICDSCVQLCSEVMLKQAKPVSAAPKIKLPTPEEIKVFLDTYVVGQDEAKCTLAVAVYNHYKRINADLGPDDVEIEKSNILMLGPTGTGKTLLAQSLAKMLDVPFAIVDATTLTQAGYVGEDVEGILQSLLAIADNDVKKAEKGIIYLDEVDKIAKKGDGPSLSRDVSGEGVQQSLLKLIEGTKINVSPRGAKKYGQTDNSLVVDTSNILFICAGAFTHIEQIIERRIGKKNIGYSSPIVTEQSLVMNSVKEVRTEDLISYGLIPEFVGRLPVVTSLQDITEQDLVRILREPKNALVKQYQKLFSMEGVELHFTDDALLEVARMAKTRKSGARGLRAVIESAMLDIMYRVPFLEGLRLCVITPEVINAGAEPLLEYGPVKQTA